MKSTHTPVLRVGRLRLPASACLLALGLVVLTLPIDILPAGDSAASIDTNESSLGAGRTLPTQVGNPISPTGFGASTFNLTSNAVSVTQPAGGGAMASFNFSASVAGPHPLIGNPCPTIESLSNFVPRLRSL